MPRHPLFMEYEVFCTNLSVFWKMTLYSAMSEIAHTHVSGIMKVILQIYFCLFLYRKHTKGGKKEDFDIYDIEFPMSEFALHSNFNVLSNTP